MTGGYRLVAFNQQIIAELDQRLKDPETWLPNSWFGHLFSALSAVPWGPPTAANPVTADGGKLAVVNAGGQLVGQVQWFLGNWYGGSPKHRGWQIGLIILPEHRRSSAALRALTLLIDYLFLNTSSNRIEAVSTSEAVPKRIESRPAGMRREGTIREAQWRDGRWHDVVMYSILRSEWSAHRDER